MDRKEVEVGLCVWAKMDSYRPWPAKISNRRKSSRSSTPQSKFAAMFYGDEDEFSWLAETHMMPLRANNVCEFVRDAAGDEEFCTALRDALTRNFNPCYKCDKVFSKTDHVHTHFLKHHADATEPFTPALVTLEQKRRWVELRVYVQNASQRAFPSAIVPALLCPPLASTTANLLLGMIGDVLVVEDALLLRAWIADLERSYAHVDARRRLLEHSSDDGSVGDDRPQRKPQGLPQHRKQSNYMRSTAKSHRKGGDGSGTDTSEDESPFADAKIRIGDAYQASSLPPVQKVYKAPVHHNPRPIFQPETKYPSFDAIAAFAQAASTATAQTGGIEFFHHFAYQAYLRGKLLTAAIPSSQSTTASGTGTRKGSSGEKRGASKTASEGAPTQASRTRKKKVLLADGVGRVFEHPVTSALQVLLGMPHMARCEGVDILTDPNALGTTAASAAMLNAGIGAKGNTKSSSSNADGSVKATKKGQGKSSRGGSTRSRRASSSSTSSSPAPSPSPTQATSASSPSPVLSGTSSLPTVEAEKEKRRAAYVKALMSAKDLQKYHYPGTRPLSEEQRLAFNHYMPEYRKHFYVLSLMMKGRKEREVIEHYYHAFKYKDPSFLRVRAHMRRAEEEWERDVLSQGAISACDSCGTSQTGHWRQFTEGSEREDWCDACYQYYQRHKTKPTKKVKEKLRSALIAPWMVGIIPGNKTEMRRIAREESERDAKGAERRALVAAKLEQARKALAKTNGQSSSSSTSSGKRKKGEGAEAKSEKASGRRGRRSASTNADADAEAKSDDGEVSENTTKRAKRVQGRGRRQRMRAEAE